MTFLLIMGGRSFLRDAMCSFFCSQMPEINTVLMESAGDVSNLTAEQRDDVGLVLLHIGDRDAGSPAVREDLDAIRAQLHSIAVVLLGDSADPSQAAMAMHAGARGYIPAFMSSEIVKHALPLIAEGGVFAPPFVYGNAELAPAWDEDVGFGSSPEADTVFPNSHELANFTEREVEVLKLLGAGLPNKVIAYRLSLKEGTVKVHMRNLMRKLKVSSRTQAALIATRHFVDS